MRIEAKDRLARARDSSLPAASNRFGAAIRAVGLTPTDFAKRSEQHPNAIFNSIAGRAFPSRKSMQLLYRSYRIDPAFIMFGDYGQLLTDVQDRIFDALLSDAVDRQESSEAWLLTGTGVSPEGTELLEIFQTLSAEFQERLLEDARILRRAAGNPEKGER